MFAAALPPASTDPGSLRGSDRGYSRSVTACATILLSREMAVNAQAAKPR